MILVVGKNSFLAKEFIGKTKDMSLRAISHAEIDNLEVFQGITCIVNFSFSPLLYLRNYDRKLDVDARLARIASDQDIHYVMLSTRKVYQETIQWGASEDAHVTGSSIYGKNKVRIEEDLTNTLGSRLTILRPGNVFGYERQPERIRFGAYLLNQLADTGVIRLTVSPFTRRDVIPVDYFCEVVREVVLRKPGGVINIGAGESLEIGRIALWIIEGFGSGRLIVEAPVRFDEFQLEIERLKSEFDLNCGQERIADFSRELGRRLRRDINQGVD